MLARKDDDTLRAAGVDSADLLAAAAAFIRTHPLRTVPQASMALSVTEAEFLNEGGALEVESVDQIIPTTNLVAITSEYAQMVATALSQKDTAELLQVSTSRIRQRMDAHTLYSMDVGAGRVCPQFQFSDQGTLPGLDELLTAISEQAHPVAVQRFFLTPNTDLESTEVPDAMSPREWLLSGHSVEPVCLLAAEL